MPARQLKPGVKTSTDPIPAACCQPTNMRRFGTEPGTLTCQMLTPAGSRKVTVAGPEPMPGHTTSKPTADLAHIPGWALGHGIELDGLTVESVTLEDVYLRLVGEDA